MANPKFETLENEPRLKIRPTLKGMSVGDVISFPIIRLKSVRTQASELSAMFGLNFHTWTDRTERLIWIKRLG